MTTIDVDPNFEGSFPYIFHVGKDYLCVQANINGMSRRYKLDFHRTSNTSEPLEINHNGLKNETHKPPNDDFRFSPQNKISIDPKNHIDSNVKQRFISKYSINTNQLDEKTGNLHGIPKHKMIIYPNPTGDLVSLQIEKVDEVDLTYQILDLSGNLVTKRKLNQTKEIQIGHLPAGSYILNVKRKSESNQFVS